MTARFTPTRLILLTGVFITIFLNAAFFGNALEAFAGQPNLSLHMLSLALLLLCLTVLVAALLGIGRALKPVLITMVLVAAPAAYFMDTYNVVVDTDMINNATATNWAETRDLLSWRLLAYLAAFAVLPSLVIAFARVVRSDTARAVRARLLLIVSTLLVIGALLALSSGFYASYFREHKSLRYYANPATPLYSLARYATSRTRTGTQEVTAIGEDARITEQDIDRELVIMVVGETARADHFSLNGYARETNPQLAREDVVSFTQMSSCGTSTAISVPCMFAIYDRSDFSDDKAQSTENALDVLARSGVNVLWRDNNSSSKGVADRVAAVDYRSPENNPVCDEECRDMGMLDGLQAYIDAHPTGDILVVLHQMGSHGPAYHKRYPQDFERFTPTCDTNELATCAAEQITNSYDNTILYTDHFLDAAIQLLRANDNHFETALMYVSDHGESLGESGVYLHGMPYFVAPQAQTHVAALMWFGRNFVDMDSTTLRAIRDKPLSHDNVFHTLLGMFEVQSTVYDAQRDILNIARSAQTSTQR